MTFVPFELERWQSAWEHLVRFNLAESGVHPMSVSELLSLAGASQEDLTGISLGYSQADGTVELRRSIARQYPGATEQNVLVTTGSAEANFITCWTLIRPDDRVAILEPTYRQTWGLAQNFGGHVVAFNLRSELDWDLDPGEVERAITADTSLVIVTNPNNPSGRVLSQDARAVILDRTRAAGAWLLADEVYSGAELTDGPPTASLWGEYDRTVVVSGLSKAYGLPGLRIGWIVAPPEFKYDAYARHDYTVICPTATSDFLARAALGARDKIRARTHAILNRNYATIDEWLRGFGDTIRWWKPDCGAICFVQYHSTISGPDLVERIRAEHGILLVPGEHFGLPGFLRLGFGNKSNELGLALEALGPALRGLIHD